MKPRTIGIRGCQNKELQGQGPIWILIAGGALLSTFTARVGYKLKQGLGMKQLNGDHNSLRENRKSREKKRSGDCSLHTSMHSFTPDEDGGYYCLSGMSEGTLKETDTSFSLVTITAPGRNKENGIMWASSLDRLEMQRKPFHKSNSSDSPRIYESGSDIFTKWDVIHNLRRQLKRRDELIMEMQDHITTLQSSLIDQVRHSAFLQSQLAATKDLLESEREIARLRKAVAGDCTREIGHPEKLGRKRLVKRINGYANGFHDGAVDPDSVDTGKVDDTIETLKNEVGELREELFSKVTELQQRLDSQVTIFYRE